MGTWKPDEERNRARISVNAAENIITRMIVTSLIRVSILPRNSKARAAGQLGRRFNRGIQSESKEIFIPSQQPDGRKYESDFWFYNG
jgi:hypothetical protein